MNQLVIKRWYLLTSCGVLYALIAVLYLVQQDAESLPFPVWHRTAAFVGKLTLAAGACAIADAVRGFSHGNRWLLALNGLAGSALGAILAFWTGPLAFRTIAFLITAMAVSLGLYLMLLAQTLRRRHPNAWLLGAAAVGSAGFALPFLAFLVKWIRLDPESPSQTLHWLGAYFAFSAVCMLMLAWQEHHNNKESRQPSTFPTMGTPRHAP